MVDFGHVDVLVTAAGVSDHRPTTACDFSQWRKIMNVNLDGTFLFVLEVGRHMRDRETTAGIILIASTASATATRPQPQAAYTYSKAGVRMLATSLSAECAPYGVRVNSLSPDTWKHRC